MNRKIGMSLALLVSTLWVPNLALAHDGHTSATLLNGLAHPLTGFDHLLAALAVGLWSINSGQKQAWLAPLVFIGAVGAGTLLGTLGLTLPFMETGLVASLLFFGSLMFMNAKASATASLLVIGLFASVHGMAHGSEMLSSASLLGYLTGILTMTTALLVVARLASATAQRQVGTVALKVSGASVAVLGVFLELSI
ncbi:HupE/UreJ family protein [Reinekea sp.]|jgi:urease accessory protein|uniref:HupE/UreJ family protein n=1 Tax=Reinekea sp. TaxID=1970455 RepID=UPI002A8008F7|nr:HupE/UreJ family protein [Reinekea sp.]